MEMQPRRLIKGNLPILISMPHIATYVPPDIKARMRKEALSFSDTDWHIDRLYDFAREMGASMLYAAYSRYVIDLNRDSADTDLYPGQVKTGLCPLQSFSAGNIYRQGEEPDGPEKVNRIAAYWQPYHDALAEELSAIKKRHGYAILYDAHSIRSVLPPLFEGKLPDLNIGTAKGTSCAPMLEGAVMNAVKDSGYSHVLNGRFVGGYITRHYGDPTNGIHAIQMEIAQCAYMDEDPPYTYDTAKAEKLEVVLKKVIEGLLATKVK